MKKIVGIVAEYNPFHRGHLYHIASAREHGDAIVVVLSSNFVQRGLPALIDKRSRAETALAGGADLVLELPAAFSCHNAGAFACGGVDILASTGVVTDIAYGVESLSWDIRRSASILNEEPAPFKHCLKEYLDTGRSYVESRALALEKILPGSYEELSRPNNSLALAYNMRIEKKNYRLGAIAIQRIGSGYHDEAPSEIASATAIRRLAERGDLDGACALMPEEAAFILRREAARGRMFIDYDRLWRIVKIFLTRASAIEELRASAEMREGLESRMTAIAKTAPSWEKFIAACVTRRYPRGRIQRHAMHFLTGFAHELSQEIQRNGAPYIRVLGANARGRELLRAMRKTAALPVITRASAPNDAYARRVMDHERRAGEIWETLIDGSLAQNEIKIVPLML